MSTSEAEILMRSIIERIATGPEMSKNISEAEAFAGMAAVLDRKVNDVQAALFLIALRMKRETTEENLGVFGALIDNTVHEPAAVDDLLTISDPYNGFNRGIPMSPFLPAVFAGCGLPCLSTGVETVAPKFGVTHHRILSAAGKTVALTPIQGARQLANPEIGWAYLDQNIISPKLHRLRELRRLMVKRSVLSTCEVMLNPVTARQRNLAYVGYVHTNYPPVYALLADAAGYDTALIVRGAEGGVIPSLQASGKLFLARGGDAGTPMSVKPELVGIRNAEARAVPAPFDDPLRNAAHAAELGLAALGGESGLARDSLVYAAAIGLYGAGYEASIEAGARTARRVLDSGEALERFKKAE